MAIIALEGMQFYAYHGFYEVSEATSLRNEKVLSPERHQTTPFRSSKMSPDAFSNLF